MNRLTTGAACVLLGSVLVGCAYSTAPVDRAEAPAPAATSAQNILGEMYQRYITARSYEDQGTLVSIIRPDDASEPSTTRTAFNTAFDRATGSFRFEYTKTHDRFFSPGHHVIWRTGSGRARVWWTTSPHQVESDDLDAGLAAMAGVSGTTSRTVPSMLLGWAAGMKRDLGYVADGDDVAGGTPCVKMSARRDAGVVTLWISKDDHSLRKVTSRNHNDGASDQRDLARLAATLPEERRAELIEHMRKPRPFVSEATIEYSPAFDRPIDPSRFEFTPPAASSADAAPK
ncbi:MAG TPA: hypothetical protein VLT33_19460 [Labilithrix sp.]|nr:hypothetical protein [Labilithrix sp.]